MMTTIDMESARMTLVSALAWRVVAELFRRYHQSCNLRVLQVHPGISMRGCLKIVAQLPEQRSAPTLYLNLGGPSGTYEVCSPFGDKELGTRETAQGNFASQLLAGDPSSAIASIASAWGLPAGKGTLPISSPTVLAVRLIAGLLERCVFSPTCWRTTAGLCENGAVGPMVPDWLTAVGVDPETIRRLLAEGSHEETAKAARFVMLHRALDDDGICLSHQAIAQRAFIFDLATGAARLVDKAGSIALFDTVTRYAAVSRNLRSLVNEYEDALRNGGD